MLATFIKQVNWLIGTSWLWKGLRGHSVTFAALFALGSLGLSVAHLIRRVLGFFGAPWLLIFLIPIIAVTIIANHEHEWMPDPVKRKRWARGLILGALAISFGLAWLAPKHPTRENDPAEDRPAVRMHGPSGK